MDNSKPKLVFLDVDRTLFDLLKYRYFMKKKISEETGMDGITEEEIYNQTKTDKEVFVPDYYLSLLSSRVDKQIHDDTRNSLFGSSVLMEYLFPDVSHFLEQASNITKLGILSKGDESFQKSKLDSFKNLLESDKIYIFKDKKTEAQNVISQNREFKIYLIDNDPETLEAYKDADSSWTTLLIERYDPLEYNGVFDFKIESLLSAVEIINK